MKKFIMYLAITLGITLFFPGCRFEHNVVRRICVTEKPVLSSADPHNVFITQAKQPSPITIWVHGTQSFSDVTFHSLFDNTAHLKHFTKMPHGCELRTIAETLIVSAPRTFDADNFYIFGWSGSLSFTARESAAKNLYWEIKHLQEEYAEKHGQRPYVRLISHSHGGNVALNMAKLHHPNDSDFYIDQLILLACPVQEHTKHNIHHSIFKQSYSLYSRLDLMQIIDPQGLYGPEGLWQTAFLSERCFPIHERVHQVKIRMHKRAITHHEFVSPAFLEQLAIVINEIDIWQQQKSFNSHKHKGVKHLISIGTKPMQTRNMG